MKGPFEAPTEKGRRTYGPSVIQTTNPQSLYNSVDDPVENYFLFLPLLLPKNSSQRTVLVASLQMFYV